MQGLAPIEQEENQIISDKVQFADQQNIKCSIEIKNGIPQRSLNNFHKNQNALVLNNYTVSAVLPSPGPPLTVIAMLALSSGEFPGGGLPGHS